MTSYEDSVEDYNSNLSELGSKLAQLDYIVEYKIKPELDLVCERRDRCFDTMAKLRQTRENVVRLEFMIRDMVAKRKIKTASDMTGENGAEPKKEIDHVDRVHADSNVASDKVVDMNSESEECIHLEVDIGESVFAHVAVPVKTALSSHRDSNNQHKTGGGGEAEDTAESVLQSFKILYNLGLNVHVEMQLREVIHFVESKLAKLESQSESLNQHIANLQAQISVAYEVLDQKPD
mmetsp:Transcript_3538/g.6296  ORF Transcript_3538/g.6296 Transcript_3538/m.6296 type:complete len:235 (-) Transcript_3538:1779-2483(-)